MDSKRISELLSPFRIPLDETILSRISTYIDLLVRWNSRINLTAIRSEEEIVTRHFGESLFAAQALFPSGLGLDSNPAGQGEAPRLFDVGSGPGFPGLPIKLWNPALRVTLIESNQKKAAFLREVIRALTLIDINVFSGRAETCTPAGADVVTLRAVERFAQSLPVAAALVKPAGRLALLIGSPQVDQAHRFLASFKWQSPLLVPNSQARVLLIGTRNQEAYPVSA